MMGFLWLCCVFGVAVEAMVVHQCKDAMALCLYLVMGWAALLPLRDLIAVLPWQAVVYLVLGGVVYTLGVPFFVRDRNLDHAVWHVFVLVAAALHWWDVYWYLVPFPCEKPPCV